MLVYDNSETQSSKWFRQLLIEALEESQRQGDAEKARLLARLLKVQSDSEHAA